MRVYALFNGCYSDTRLVGVYSTLERAEMAARVFRDAAAIEQHEIDPELEAMRQGHTPYFVRLQRATGNVLNCYESESTYGAFDSSVGVDVNMDLYTTCWASNREHAIKIASERRRAFLANEAA